MALSAGQILGALSYAAYGNEFIQHSYVYHLSRKVTSAWCPSRRDMMPIPSPVSNFFRITGTTSHPASTYHTWRTMEISRTSSSIVSVLATAHSQVPNDFVGRPSDLLYHDRLCSRWPHIPFTRHILESCK
eukprot:scaffold3142_cov416-Prasinococcus_capsulatus_cf.AAC.5